MHHPKGEMCVVCKKSLDDCSTLNFESMKVIETYEQLEEKHFIVKCTEFSRKENKMASLRELHKQRKSDLPKLINPVPNPRYDEVYHGGVEEMGLIPPASSIFHVDR